MFGNGGRDRKASGDYNRSGDNMRASHFRCRVIEWVFLEEDLVALPRMLLKLTHLALRIRAALRIGSNPHPLVGIFDWSEWNALLYAIVRFFSFFYVQIHFSLRQCALSQSINQSMHAWHFNSWITRWETDLLGTSVILRFHVLIFIDLFCRNHCDLWWLGRV